MVSSSSAQIALRKFSDAYAEHGDSAPTLFALVGEVNQCKGGPHARIPPELVHPNAHRVIGNQLSLSGNATVHINPFRTTLFAVGRGALRTDEGIYECDFVLRGEHLRSEAEERAVESFRREAKSSGAALLAGDFVQVDVADSSLVLWVCNTFGLLHETTWVRQWPNLGNRRVFSYHPFAASIEAWKRLLSRGQGGWEPGRKSGAKNAGQVGRMKADFETVQKEAELADEWVRAREAGVSKVGFAETKRMKVKDLDRLLDRVYRRNKRSDN